jgi:hypothetical protein
MSDAAGVRVERLPLSAIRADWSRNPREGKDEGTVAEYAEAYRRGDDLPPLAVFRDDRGVNHLSRGFHRYEGAKVAGLAAVECEVRKGDARDAMLFAMAERPNGLPRTRGDLARLADLAIRDRDLRQMSNRELAKLYRCDEGVFRRRRAQDRANTGATGGTDSARSGPGAGGAGGRGGDPAVPASPPPPSGGWPGGAVQPHPEPQPVSGGGVPETGPKPVALPRDSLGRPLPEHLVAVFERAAEFEAAAAKVGNALGQLRALDADPEVGSFLKRRPHLEGDGKELAAFVRRRLKPYCVCPACGGDGDAGQCPSCGGRGWLTRSAFGELPVPAQEEARKFAPGDAWEGDDPGETVVAADAERYQPAAPGRDPLGTPIPAELRDLFHADWLWEEARRLDRLFTALQSAKGWLDWLKPETLDAVASAARGVRDAIPYCVCPACRGKKCGRCKLSGCLPRWLHEGEQGVTKCG